MNIMKKWISNGVILSLFLAVLMVPCPGNAVYIATSTGQASIDYGSISLSAVDGAGAPVTINWFDPADPTTDLRGTMSGVSTSIGGVVELYDVDTIDGAPWGDTSKTATHHLSNAMNSASGSASTNVSVPTSPSLLASADVSMTNSQFGPSPFPPIQEPFNRIGSVDIAQAVFSGQFTVDVDATFNAAATYQLQQALNNLAGALFSSSDLLVGLVLSDFWTTDPLTGQSLILSSSFASLSHLINGAGMWSDAASGALNITNFQLLQFYPGTTIPIIYDFEAFASARGAAAVPEPITLVLLGSGLVGLAIFGKRFV